MQITFGWGYDGARWSDHQSLKKIVTGPQSMTALLASKLGVTQPAESKLKRTAAYRSATDEYLRSLSEIELDDHWLTESFKKDSWSTSKYILSLRDELVASGWNLRLESPKSDLEALPERLETILEIEKLFQNSPHSSLSNANLLLDVKNYLEELLTELPTAERENAIFSPLGLKQITVEHTQSDLPLIWNQVFDLLSNFCQVTYKAPQFAQNPTINTVNVLDEWQAASVAAKVLAEKAKQLDGNVEINVISNRETTLLDYELERLNMPRVGVSVGEASEISRWALATFIETVSHPFNVHAAEATANLRFSGTLRTAEAPIVSRSFLPAWLSRGLINHFNDLPGVGGETWEKRKAQWFEKEVKDVELAQEFLELIETTPLRAQNGRYLVKAVSEMIDWFRKAMTVVNQAINSSDGKNTNSNALEIKETIQQFGETITVSELHKIIADASSVGVTATSATLKTVNDKTVSFNTVITPGKIGDLTNFTLWYLPADNFTTHKGFLRDEEKEFLKNDSVTNKTFDPDAILKQNKLTLESYLAVLKRLPELTVIVPVELDTEEFAEHPALTLLKAASEKPGNQTGTKRATEQKTKKEPKAKTEDYAYLNEETKLPEVELTRLNPAEITISKGAEHLLPEKLSYTQWNMAINRPIDWLLNYGLGIKNIQKRSEALYLGSWAHDAIEQLIRTRANPADFKDGTTEIVFQQPKVITLKPGEALETLERFIPSHASILNLPGNNAKKSQLLYEISNSIEEFFRYLSDNKIQIVAVEESFNAPLKTTKGELISGKEGRPIRVGGKKDLHILIPRDSASGTQYVHGVIDFKNTAKTTSYAADIENGLDLQLEIYAYATRETAKVSSIATAYYLLRNGTLITHSPAFEDDTIVHRVTKKDEESAFAFQRALTSLQRFFEDLRAGTIYDPYAIEAAIKEHKKDLSQIDDSWQTYFKNIEENGYYNQGTAQYRDFGFITGFTEV